MGRGPGVAEVLECNVNAAGDDVVVTYDETQDGVDTTVLGQPCMDVVDAHSAQGASFGIARPIPATDTSDPGCLIWDIDSGTIGDNVTRY